MLNLNNKILSQFLLLCLLTLFATSCSSGTKNEFDSRSDRYLECEMLADKATLLGFEALQSGETNFSSPEWQTYDKARDRYKILNCKEWWPLPYS
jgi:hypothetical protein